MHNHQTIDPYFHVSLISQTPNPQQTVYAAMHQDYSESFVAFERDRWPTEGKCGEIITRRLLKPMHFGPLEHPQMVLNVGWFPHSTMQQLRTHRVGISFDVQCLAGYTLISFVDSEQETFKYEIQQIHDMFLADQDSVKSMQVPVLNEETKCFVLSHIKNVVENGMQVIYKVTFADGKTLDCTTSHKLFTDTGWQTMGRAVGLVRYPDGSTKELTRECSVWSRDEDPTDPAAYLNKIVNVEVVGLGITYDLELEDPWHNFVANGVVVHNSSRYTGKRIVEVADGTRKAAEVFYLRPEGFYTDRKGNKYEYTEEQRQEDLELCMVAAEHYKQRIDQGFSEEHARGLVPFDIRQHWVMSGNTRTWMHIFDMRWKADAQLECQQLCDLIWPHFEDWVPAIAEWYADNRMNKGRLAP